MTGLRGSCFNDFKAATSVSDSTLADAAGIDPGSISQSAAGCVFF